MLRRQIIMSKIITISREFGSGGHFIGENVAKKLGITFYDSQILEKIAEETGFSKKIIEDQGEYSPSKSIFSYAFVGRDATGSSISDKIYNAQSEIIRELAKKESFVIIGRCADYILKDNPDVISVFCYSDVEERIQWSIDEYQVPAKQAKKIVQEKDTQRARFYEFYTNQKWGNARNYTLMINTSKMSTDEAVQLLASFYDVKKGIPTFKNAFENQYEKNNTY